MIVLFVFLRVCVDYYQKFVGMDHFVLYSITNYFLNTKYFILHLRISKRFKQLSGNLRYFHDVSFFVHFSDHLLILKQSHRFATTLGVLAFCHYIIGQNYFDQFFIFTLTLKLKYWDKDRFARCWFRLNVTWINNITSI